MEALEFLCSNGGFDISHEQARDLNNKLANIKYEDIPLGSRAHVTDYLITALNMESVDIDISPSLEALLESLQEIK